jgi:uncharacterized protein (TIGR04255 family)
MPDVDAGPERIPERHPLGNKPLVEAIFELRWGLTPQQQGMPIDPGFRIFLGRYYDQVKAEYPVVVDLPSSTVPEEITPHQVRHQFRKAQDDWPVTQIGPGIMTVNETSGYLWDTFHPRLQAAIEAVYAAYPREIAAFHPMRGSLKYVDAIEYNPETSPAPLLAYLRSHLHTGIDIEPLLFKKNAADREAPIGLNLTVAYPLSKPPGIIQLTIALGKREDRPSIILDTTVLSRKDAVPQEAHEWQRWLLDAHEVSDDWFFALVRGDLLKEFERTHDTSNVEV